MLLLRWGYVASAFTATALALTALPKRAGTKPSADPYCLLGTGVGQVRAAA
ncbi:hypothetical protein [Streptomyces sp. NPDC008265]|uniref:hypothetical protein n=1 Tax=Streptomyces sp. NPDC008265 TaxID=3364824 RepID=UPI0036F0AEA6